MYNSITGIVTEIGDGYVYLLTGSEIEWVLLAGNNTLRDLKLNERAKLLVYTQYKEDDVTLFGFSKEQERTLFKNLIKVNGIGPKAAMKAISGWSVESFLTALEKGDAGQIANIPGIGKKTAEKIIFTLKGKITENTGSGVGIYSEIVESLVTMGFDHKAAQTAVNDVIKEMDETPNESLLLQQAIIKLSTTRQGSKS